MFSTTKLSNDVGLMENYEHDEDEDGDDLGTSILKLSPPHDGSEFELFPEITGITQHNTCSITDNNKHRTTTNTNQTSTKAIQIKMSSDQEQELVDYLTGKRPITDNNIVHELKSIPNGAKIIVSSSNIVPSSLIERVTSSHQTYPVLSKNAIAARENRLRKKMYVDGLERSVSELKTENFALKSKTDCMSKTIDELNTEVTYLRSILANQGAISALLENINHNTSKLQFSSSIIPTSENALGQSDECIDVGVNEQSKSDLIMGRKRCHSGEDICTETTKRRSTRSQALKEANTVPGRKSSRKSPIKSVINNDHAYSGNSSSKNIDCNSNNVESTPGICLHVKGNQVSLELCNQCSSKASTVWSKKNK